MKNSYIKQDKLIERIERPLFRIDKYIWEEMAMLTNIQKIMSFYQWDITHIRINEREMKDAKNYRT